MKLIGAHYTTNLVTFPFVVKGHDAGPETGDLEHHLSTVELQKLDIVGDLEVLPHVVRDSTPHVALKVRVIGHPALRARVQVDPLVSSRPSLPLCQGNIAPL